ncbi:CHAT domain-containing protein [Nocardiopsis dassonvillei]
MLASVGLGDGPLLACDLAGLPEAPDTVVLSTCWSGRGFADRAGAPLGFTGALLAAGVRTVVASPVPVRDAGTVGAMRLFHRALAAGVPAPEAVAVHLGRAGFCCFGA